MLLFFDREHSSKVLKVTLIFLILLQYIHCTSHKVSFILELANSIICTTRLDWKRQLMQYFEAETKMFYFEVHDAFVQSFNDLSMAGTL